ncbi:MAG TPA: RluA family pseudouridine synthase [Desulfomonilia bacterium]
METKKRIILKVSAEDSGSRLDVFLAKRAGISRSAATRLVSEDKVTVDSLNRKPSFAVSAGMRVALEPEEEKTSDILPWETELNILYDDEAIIVIDKPAGLVVHPGAGNFEKTLVHALIARYPQMANVGSIERPGIVHRLDKLTSGVMVVAKNQQAYSRLSDAFKDHTHKRVYICICFGMMPRNSGRIESLINRNPGDRKKMTSKAKSGRTAITNWEVMKSWPGFSMLKLSLETGRTHQIRVHLSDLGHPIVGDVEYGGKGRAANIANADVKAYVRKIERQMLHAHILGINHPETGEYMEFISQLPEDMILLEQELNRNYS